MLSPHPSAMFFNGDNMIRQVRNPSLIATVLLSASLFPGAVSANETTPKNIATKTIALKERVVDQNAVSDRAVNGGPRQLPSASLILTPGRCVALHQGQVCYQRVQISWSSSLTENYCVYQQDLAAPLQCWQQQWEATLDVEFAADDSRLFQLKDRDQQVLAEATLEVAWVYKTNTRRKTHWRLF